MANTDGPWVRFFASDWLAGTRGMTAAETGVYITLIALMYERDDGTIERDDRRLARMCGLKQHAFIAILEDLIGSGKITVEDARLGNHRAAYESQNRADRAIKARNAALAKAERNQGSKSANAPSKQSVSSARQVPRAHASEPEPDSEGFSIENPKGRSPSAPSRAEQESWWLEFWAMFPNKVGKADAGKAFARAIKRTDRQTMIIGLERYVSKTDDRPWCNPSTWLNQDRWADQPAQVQRGSPTRSSRPPSAAELATDLLREMEQADERNAEAERNHPPVGQHAITGPR